MDKMYFDYIHPIVVPSFITTDVYFLIQSPVQCCFFLVSILLSFSYLIFILFVSH